MDHDVIIIGGGAGGLGAARAGRWAGADVALVNDGPIGGDCTFTGCVPSKTLLAAARDGLGFAEAMARVRSTIDRIAATETADVLRRDGITVIEGRGRLAEPRVVEVDGRRLTARHIILATGSRPLLPPIPGLEQVSPLTNEEIFGIEGAPASLGVVGGGPIGCELAQAFAGLGVAVTLFEAEGRLLPREEREASAVLAESLERDGVEVRVGSPIQQVRRSPSGVSVSTGEADVCAEQLLVAAGRVPNSHGMGLEEVGVGLDERGFIETDGWMRTTRKGVFAVGDVTGHLGFTHAADEMGRLAMGNALRKGVRGRFRTSWIPWVTFTSPEVARIGVTEAEAVAMGGRVAHLPMSELDRAVTDDRTDGFITLIAGPRRLLRHAYGGKLIGATIVGPRAGEMIHEAALAMRTGMFTGRLAQTAHAYPTWSSGMQKAAGQFFGSVEGRRAHRAGCA